MNNPGVKKDVWIALRQKWTRLVDQGHALKVEFKIVKDPHDEAKELAIDVAQNVDGEWVVQTVQRQVQEAYPAIGIEGLGLDQLITLARDIVNSVTKPITGRATYDDEMHLFMKRISSETSEIHGHIISKTGEKVGIRANYQHYYVLNEILEQIQKIMQEEYSELQVQRDKDDNGRLYFRFVPA